MVNRDNPPAARDNRKSGSPVSQSTLAHASSPQTRRSTTSDILINDDLIRSLSDAYENRRARQVFEWERTRLQSPPAFSPGTFR